MRKVLFAIKWYPPRASANVLCDDKIIQEILVIGEYDEKHSPILYMDFINKGCNRWDR